MTNIFCVLMGSFVSEVVQYFALWEIAVQYCLSISSVLLILDCRWNLSLCADFAQDKGVLVRISCLK